MTLWLRLTGTATPGRLGHWAPRPCQSRGRRGGSGPLIGWRAWPSPEPPRRLIGCAAQMTSSVLSKKPAGRPLCSPQPIVGVGGPTSPPGPGAAQLGVNAVAVGRCTWVRDPRGGGAGARPRCDLWPYGHSSRASPPPGSPAPAPQTRDLKSTQTLCDRRSDACDTLHRPRGRDPGEQARTRLRRSHALKHARG